MPSKLFWNFKAKAKDEADLYLYEEIGDSWWGDSKSAKQFKKDLDALGDIKSLTIYVNSPGGDVFDGMAIYNILKRHKAYKTVHVDGLAASIASVIALAGDKLIIPSNAYFMVHRAWSWMIGNKNDMYKMGEDLERIDEGIINVYVAKTGMTRQEVIKLMDDETWMTGEEAKEYGFADEVEVEKKLAASIKGDSFAINGKEFNLKNFRFKNLPKLVNEDSEEEEQQEETDQTEQQKDTPEEKPEQQSLKEAIENIVRSVVAETTNEVKNTPKSEESPAPQSGSFDIQKHLSRINQLVERRQKRQ